MATLHKKAKRFSENIFRLTQSKISAKESFAQIESQIDKYEQQINLISADLNILKAEYEIIDRELDAFLSDYYSKIYQYVLDLNSSNLQNTQIKELAENILMMNTKKAEARDIELKKIYRRLVKIYHPDALNLGDIYRDEGVFAKIQNYYEQKNFYKLTEILNNYESENFSPIANLGLNAVEVLELTEKKYFMLSIEKKTLEKKIFELSSSSEYKLFERVKWGNLQGFNVMNEIIYHIQKNNI